MRPYICPVGIDVDAVWLERFGRLPHALRLDGCTLEQLGQFHRPSRTVLLPGASAVALSFSRSLSPRRTPCPPTASNPEALSTLEKMQYLHFLQFITSNKSSQ